MFQKSVIVWPHSPPHYLGGSGVYMVTSGTYRKAHYFRSRARLRFLTNRLLELAAAHGWKMQAWAVFSNHYHWIGSSPENGAEGLGEWIAQLHRESAFFVNGLDDSKGRKVWHNYWESHITYEKSYYARLQYVHQNPVRHGLVERAGDYDWCSANWFARVGDPAFVKTVESFKVDRVKVYDEF